MVWIDWPCLVWEIKLVFFRNCCLARGVIDFLKKNCYKLVSYLHRFQREGVIDFSFHYLPEYIDWVTTKAKPEAKWMAVFKPFTPITWAFIFAFAFGSGPVLALLVHLSEYDPINNVYGVWRSVIYVFSVFFINNTVESTTLPQKPAPQFFLLGWWLFW